MMILVLIEYSIKQEPLTLKMIASLCHQPMATAMRYLDYLWAKGLVTKRVDPRDRRRVNVTATEKLIGLFEQYRKFQM